MALGMPSGGGYSANDGVGSGLGGVGAGVGGTYNPGLSGYQQALNNYAQGASGMNLGNYNNAMGAIGAQRNAINGAYGSAAGQANRDYGLALRGINQDLMFGNQLRGQEEFRNVDMARRRSGLDLWRADRMWGIQQGDINARVGFAGRGFGLANRDTRAQYTTGTRNLMTDAITRGARSAAGTLANSQDLGGQRQRGLQGNQLQYDTTLRGLRTERQQGRVGNQFAHQSYGLDMKTIASIARTYGIQAAQAAADAALARDRAASSRAGAVGSAGSGRTSALAGLAGAQQNAYNNYMQTQMGLFAQLAGAG